MKITSTSFVDGKRIPDKYTADGEDVSPPLSISGVDPKAASFALIMDDPDAPMGTFTHWLVWDIPASFIKIPEGVPKDKEVKSLGGAKQGRTDFGRAGYGGPSPPPGPVHRYRFKLYSLDRMLGIRAGVSRGELELAMKGHVLAEAMLTGLYGR